MATTAGDLGRGRLGGDMVLGNVNNWLANMENLQPFAHVGSITVRSAFTLL